MDGQELQDGKARVLKHLIEPLDRLMKLPRPAGAKAFEHVAGLAEIQQRLAHLSADELKIVRETLVDASRSEKGKARWPKPAIVIANGLALRLPEGGETERVRKLLVWAVRKGVMGSVDMPWLYLWLRRNVAPPMQYDLEKIAEQADAERRALDRIKRESDAGLRLTSEDAQLRERIRHASERVAVIVEAASEAA